MLTLCILCALTGLLRVNGRIDYETQHNVTLIAQAFDSGSPQRQNTTVVFINIININDNTPVFNQVQTSGKDAWTSQVLSCDACDLINS